MASFPGEEGGDNDVLPHPFLLIHPILTLEPSSPFESNTISFPRIVNKFHKNYC